MIFAVPTTLTVPRAIAAVIDDLDITKAPTVEQVTGNSAIIKWGTTAQASATVKYGTDRNNLDKTAHGGWGGPDHNVTLSGLQPNTTYYYQVLSTDAKGSGTGAIAKTESFRTGATGSTTSTPTPSSPSAGALKIVAGPDIEFLGDSHAQIAWSTNVESSAIVHYGTDPNNLSQTAEQAWGGTKTKVSAVHRVKLDNLKPATTYYYQVESGQGYGTGSSVKGQVASITTKNRGEAASNAAKTSLIQAGPVPQNVTDTTANLWWMSPNNPGAVTVKYGTDKNNLSQTATSTGSGNEQQVKLSGLQPATTYYFQVTGGDLNSSGQFKTEATGYSQAKFRFTNGPVLERVGNNDAVIAWSTNARSSSLLRYGTDANNLDQTATSPWGQETHRVHVRNLKPNTTYYFTVESAQAEGTGMSDKSNVAPFTTVGDNQQAMVNTPK